MQLNKEQLDEVELYAGLLFTPEQICIILESNLNDFKNDLQNSDTDVYKKFYRGLLLTQTKVRKKLIDFAEKGNQQCLDKVEELIKKINTALP